MQNKIEKIDNKCAANWETEDWIDYANNIKVI